ncbi:uncharacterized protein [Argopecten irradians]|uniref:uncharacterized protein n=1 Tax=Argopecten irradians TaxID=31199 RepID=UPI003723C5C0
MEEIGTNHEVIYLNIAMNEREEKDQCSAFLYIIGQEGREIFNTLTFTEDENNKIEPLFEKFKLYCAPRENITVWRHRFYTRAQKKSETIDMYLTELRVIAKNCKFGALEEEMLRDRIVCGVASDKVKERLLRDNDLTLAKTLTICRANEESLIRMKNIQDSGEEVCAISKESPDRGRPAARGKVGTSSQKSVRKGQGQAAHNRKQSTVQYTCGKCGTKHQRGQCPAYGKKCLKCHKLNPTRKCVGLRKSHKFIQ